MNFFKKRHFLSTLVFVTIILVTFFTVNTHHTHAAVIGVPPKLLPGTGLSRGLVGWWSFDGKDTPNGRASDLSGNGNSGSLTNIATSTFYVPGKIGQGFRFDGVDDYVDTGNSSWISQSFSVSAWIKTSYTGASQVIVSKLTGASAWQFSANILNTGAVYFKLYGTTSGTDQKAWASTATGFNDGKWHHVVFTAADIDGTNVKTITMYVDGVVRPNSLIENTGKSAYTVKSSNINIGARFTPSLGFPFNGTIDDVRIYSRVLSATEVIQLYNIGAATKQATSPQLTATSTCSYGLSCGLVGYWTFDGKDVPNGVARDVAGGNNGNLLNIATSTFYVPGKIGQAFKFNGSNDYLQIVDATNLRFNGTETFSISLWFNTRTISLAEAKAILYKGNNGDPENTNYAIALDTSNKINFFWEYGNGSNDSLLTNSTVSANKWYHVVVVWDGTLKNIYLNGSFDNSSTPAGGPTNGSNRPITIGYNLAGTSAAGFAFPGSVDDVRIYNRALSAAEITELYNIGAATKQATSPQVTATSTCSYGLSCGLVGYWTFDGKDVPNGRANDLSGNANHGSLTNIATSTFYVPGKIGQGFRFDGVNDYVSTGYATALGDFTACIWFNSNGNSSTARLLDKSYQTGFWMGRSSTASNQWGGGVIESASPFGRFVTLSNNVWHHICSIRSGTTHTIIGDGGAVTTSGTVSSSALSTTALTIGVETSGPVSYFKGSLDDVRIYNRALSATEIRQLYNSGR